MDDNASKAIRSLQPKLRDQLSTRIIGASILALIVALGMIFGTLWLSWQLEGAAAAINDTGSLRMRATRLAVHLANPGIERDALASEEMASIDVLLADLQRGDPIRPLFLPASQAVMAQMERVSHHWHDTLRPAAEAALTRGNTPAYLERLPTFVAEANELVGLIESDNAGKITLLRLSQGVLIVIACVGTLAMVYLLYLWIIVPVQQLQRGLQRMASRDFAVRLPVESHDEFGVLADGFNRMAEELQNVYGDLENRVKRKTAQLAEQNKELGALYDMAAFLNQSQDIDAVCHGFLQRIMQQFNADGCSLRVIDPDGNKLHLVASEGLPEEIIDAEHCMNKNACFCGTATEQGVVVIKDFSKIGQHDEPFSCEKAGFTSLAVFRILNRNEVLGSFSLHFRNHHEVPPAETHLLEALGQQLGVALENRRLGAKARQLAIAEERNLVAQGLHDSIAQGLNYLNLQVQMLNDAMRRGRTDEAQAIVPLLQTGVSESYQDVRELLANFRDKLSSETLHDAVNGTLQRFTRQTAITPELDIEDSLGAPLAPEQQLQVLFVLQEALSNIRKHAAASHVRITIQNLRDFVLIVSDDGRGFDPDEIADRIENQHVGLGIMQERASRLGAQLNLASQPGKGTTLTLILPEHTRLAA